MALLEGAKKIAAEFEYTAEDVNTGVKAFMGQMGMSRAWESYMTG